MDDSITKNKEYRRKRRQEIISKLTVLKNNLKCDLCPENHISCLDFHHRDMTAKDFSISDAIRNRLSYPRILREIDKCQVLCSNCHRKLHYNLRHEEK